MSNRAGWLRGLKDGDAVGIQCSHSGRIIPATVIRTFEPYVIVQQSNGRAGRFDRVTGYKHEEEHSDFWLVSVEEAS